MDPAKSKYSVEPLAFIATYVIYRYLSYKSVNTLFKNIKFLIKIFIDVRIAWKIIEKEIFLFD